MGFDYGRARVIIATLILVLVASPLFAQGGAPSEQTMVEQRLRSDLEDLREENESLEQEIERLREQEETETDSVDSERLEELRGENERLRSLVEKYRTIVDSFVRRVNRIDTRYQPVPETDEQVTGSPDSPEEADEEDLWTDDPNRPYPIRTHPLREEITYVTEGDDTLSKIAHQFYHDAELWIRIYLVNENRLESPDTLPPGTRLRLPPLDRIQQD
jgi:predicted nuclease with TOPRIM domain